MLYEIKVPNQLMLGACLLCPLFNWDAGTIMRAAVVGLMTQNRVTLID